MLERRGSEREGGREGREGERERGELVMNVCSMVCVCV